ncbi:tyrosine-type recombinase/integrase [Flavobacterium sp. Sd200]|uniref:site-specific integrase n=1 Tax=Flavobacterium sp. Sd200 TaxID=2692211 RepID=UPI0013711BCB|nr:site-specific integrase [Flavobacterium sp. Sd200]MXN91747.1 tyrosine-type recombinase/integrase [Flavobacterium sp. Sd200]
MLENSFRLTFFLKSPKKVTSQRLIYLRITVDGIAKETSTKQKWDVRRWDQQAGRATGNKEDAKAINFYLDSVTNKIVQFKAELILNSYTITAQRIIDFILGKDVSRAKLLDEFQRHNDEMRALVDTGQYAIGTHTRFVIAKGHVKDFIEFKYHASDIEFRDLNYEFIKDYEFYLKTVKHCNNNTTLKHITYVRKMVLRAINKDILQKDPFGSFRGKRTKVVKSPLNLEELNALENYSFSTRRLSVIRDVFIFQCYTGLAYVDVFNLKRSDIKNGIDGKLWIIKTRQKTDSPFHVPLLPQAIKIIDLYKDDPTCQMRGTILPVASNQKMNEYLKEIAALCGITCNLNTHKARRTFGSTVTLANGVPIHVVKEMLGHSSVKQTEEYAITEQMAIGREMDVLEKKFTISDKTARSDESSIVTELRSEIESLKLQLAARS